MYNATGLTRHYNVLPNLTVNAISVVMDSQTGLETADFSRVRPSPKPRFFAAVSDGFGSSVR